VHSNSLLEPLLERGVVVLTASRRLAHAMRLRYAQYAQAQGHVVWRTPEVLPWSAWLRQQRLALRVAAGTHPFARLLTSAQSRVLWDDIVANSRVGRDLLAPSNAARLAARSWRRLHDYLIPLDELAAVDTAETRALLGWGREFQRRCDALGVIDEARLAHVLFDAEFVPDERVAFAGFDVIVPSMQRLIDRWRSHDRIVDVESDAGDTAAVEVVAAVDATAEIELAAQWARTQVEQGAGSVGVIVGDLQSRREAVRRAFEDVFVPGQRHAQAESSSIPVVIAAPPPLATYAMVDAALLVLRLAIGESDSTTAGRLLRSPFLVGGVSERSQRALADRKLREKRRERWDWFEIERWASLQRCDRLALAARRLTASLRGESRQAAPSEWAERYQAMLLRIGWPGERTLTSAERQTLEKFQEALAEFGALDTVAPRLTSQQALQRFQELLRETPFEPETTNATVIVIDAATSAGMHFDAVWVVGLQADTFPASTNPNALIPLGLQRAAGIPEATPNALLHLAHLQLRRWTRSAHRVVLSWPERDGDAELSMSPLLLQFSPGAAPPAGIRTLRETLFAHRPDMELVSDERAPVVAGTMAAGGAAILELQSRCPFRAQAQLRLKAESLERVGIGVEPPQRGGILHEVLHEIWKGLGSQEALLQLSNQELERRVRESAQRHAMRILEPDTRVRERLASLEVDSAVRQVMQVLAIERERPGFEVRFAEASELYAIGGVNVTLRPDRIDELADGGTLLIDYKLGDANRPTQWLDRTPGRPRSPQLPLYGLAHAHGDRLRALAFVVLAAGKVEYRGWSDGVNVGPGVVAYPPKRPRADLGDPSDWQALQDRWRFTLTRLAERYVAGEAAVDPLPGECDMCHLSTLCRNHELGIEEQAEADDE
jgi:probable DNA repair protein